MSAILRQRGKQERQRGQQELDMALRRKTSIGVDISSPCKKLPKASSRSLPGLAAIACTAASVAFSWAVCHRVEAPGLGGRKVLFLGPGCGHVAYTMGFVGGLLDDAVLRAEIMERGAVFGGTSSGAAAAAYAMASLHGIGSMKYWYYTEMRRGFELVTNYSTLAMGDGLEDAAYRYIVKCLKAGGHIDDAVGVAHSAARQSALRTAGPELLPWLQSLPMSVTELTTLRPRFVTTFEDSSEEFALVALASSYVPGLMGTRPWIMLHGRRVFDGYASLWRTSWPDNYMFVSFLPTLPTRILGRHHLEAYKYDSTDNGWLGMYLGVLPKASPWVGPVKADAAFRRGVADATRHRLELRTSLLGFLRSA